MLSIFVKVNTLSWKIQTLVYASSVVKSPTLASQMQLVIYAQLVRSPEFSAYLICCSTIAFSSHLILRKVLPCLKAQRRKKMKKTRVLSLRIPLEDLQSCFDFCALYKAPTTIASSAITRTLSILLSDLRASKSLPEYTASAIEQSCRAYKSIENPTSMPSLELSSISSLSSMAPRSMPRNRPAISANDHRR